MVYDKWRFGKNFALKINFKDFLKFSIESIHHIGCNYASSVFVSAEKSSIKEH
jgi:hypothetical protein